MRIRSRTIDSSRRFTNSEHYDKQRSWMQDEGEKPTAGSTARDSRPILTALSSKNVYSNPADHTELKRERWTATFTYVFRENVKNNELAVNPLGLTIVRFRADQAFS